MLDRPPREREWLSWLYVALWAFVIFLTVPFAFDLITFVKDTWGLEVLTYGTCVVIVLITIAALRFAANRPNTTHLTHVSLIGIAGLFVFLTFRLGARHPAEALHYLEYGLLSVLIYRAFTHRIHDYSIFIAVAIVGTIVGIVDETIQWLTPRRFFTLEDIGLNLTALVLVQAALATGMRPTLITGWPDAASLRRVCHLGALVTALLALCFLNTPDRVGWYTEKIPFLGFIQDNRSAMIEHGYLHEDAEIGLFRSRLTIEELLQSASERAVEEAQILDQYRERKQYGEFLRIYNSVEAPFLHEARVHLFRRDIYLERGDNAADEKTRREKYTVAYWENRILEKYFGPLLQASSFVWSAEIMSKVKDNADTSSSYESSVSRLLITEFSSRQLLWLSLGVLIGLILLGRHFGKRAKS